MHYYLRLNLHETPNIQYLYLYLHPLILFDIIQS